MGSLVNVSLCDKIFGSMVSDRVDQVDRKHHPCALLVEYQNTCVQYVPTDVSLCPGKTLYPPFLLKAKGRRPHQPVQHSRGEHRSSDDMLVCTVGACKPRERERVNEIQNSKGYDERCIISVSVLCLTSTVRYISVFNNNKDNRKWPVTYLKTWESSLCLDKRKKAKNGRYEDKQITVSA